jgi:26S proteasome non-ATPase regulatory subunit 9
MSIDDSSLGLPFAVFDEVQERSPAALDGIRYGDQLIKFGSVVGRDNSLQRLAREGQLNEGLPVPVIVLRHGAQVQLSVTPRRWMGNGLLG